MLRTWTVIDWCNRDTYTNGETWTHVQKIKIIDDELPILSVPEDILVRSIEDNCTNTFVQIPLATATDYASLSISMILLLPMVMVQMPQEFIHMVLLWFPLV